MVRRQRTPTGIEPLALLEVTVAGSVNWDGSKFVAVHEDSTTSIILSQSGLTEIPQEIGPILFI